VRSPDARSVASIPAISIRPPKPPSRSPTACSIVDLPVPDGPSSATISPGMISRFTPRRTSMVSPPCRKLRVRSVRRTTGLFIAQHLHGIGAGGPICRIESRQEAEPHRHQADEKDFERVGPRRELGQEANLGIPHAAAADEL